MTTTLRDNPILTDQGVRSWPPTWMWTGGKERTTVAGEIGVLQDVKTHDAISSQCFLFMKHDEATFIGRISLDSAALCQKLVKQLKQHCGESLKSIGELGIDLADLQRSL